jgi:hypothetical protein
MCSGIVADLPSKAGGGPQQFLIPHTDIASHRIGEQTGTSIATLALDRSSTSMFLLDMQSGVAFVPVPVRKGPLLLNEGPMTWMGTFDHRQLRPWEPKNLEIRPYPCLLLKGKAAYTEPAASWRDCPWRLTRRAMRQ